MVRIGNTSTRCSHHSSISTIYLHLHLRSCFALTSSLLIDHDIFDGWGSYDDTLLHCETWRGIYNCALENFMAFQVTPATSSNIKTLNEQTYQHCVCSTAWSEERRNATKMHAAKTVLWLHCRLRRWYVDSKRAHIY